MRSFEECRALVVDDQRMMTTLLSTILSRIGFLEVQVAHDGEAALALLGRERFDLVLSDIRMEGMDGLRLLSAIRQEPALAGLPVVLTTIGTDPAVILNARRLGASDILLKPFSPETLRARLERLPALPRAA